MNAAPSLLSRTGSQYEGPLGDVSSSAHSLLDLMYDGFYALFMMKNRCTPQDGANFQNKMLQFLGEFDRNAKKMGVSADDIHAAKYAFCATVDETILRSQFDIRPDWERQPLQLTMFGDQLAGENFFEHLEDLRAKGSVHIQSLEVFHMCLLLGFQGKYILEGSEKLNYLTARLGDEIAQMKGKSSGFSPHADRPDQIVNKLKNETPLWVMVSIFALIAMLSFLAMHWRLSKTTQTELSAYNDVVKMTPKTANLTITLP